MELICFDANAEGFNVTDAVGAPIAPGTVLNDQGLVVPESGPRLMLAAGMGLLWWLQRRRCGMR